MKDTFSLSMLIPYISWEHFFFPWKVKPGTDEASSLKMEALDLLRELEPNITVNYLLKPFQVHTEADDIIIGNIRIPFLRQQVPNADGVCLSIADFISDGDTVGVFATTVQTHDIPDPVNDDPYRSLLLLTISDRLAEAAAECLQAKAEASLGFGGEGKNVIRPAVGYPSIPDMSVNFLLDSLCHFNKIGISLTENGMMQPHSSVSGFMISHPLAQFFAIGPITDEQVSDYAQRRGFSIEETKKYIYA